MPIGNPLAPARAPPPPGMPIGNPLASARAPPPPSMPVGNPLAPANLLIISSMQIMVDGGLGENAGEHGQGEGAEDHDHNERDS